MTCENCGGSLRSDNRSGFCQRTESCKSRYYDAYSRLRGQEFRRQRSDSQSNRRRKFALELADSQGWVCAWPLCGQQLGENIAVDHNHRDGTQLRWDSDRSAIRGVVHTRCNGVIWGLEEALKSGQVVVSAAVSEYLERGT